MVITEAFPEDSGIFKCIAENEFGAVASSAHLFVFQGNGGFFSSPLSRLYSSRQFTYSGWEMFLLALNNTLKCIRLQYMPPNYVLLVYLGSIAQDQKGVYKHQRS